MESQSRASASVVIETLALSRPTPLRSAAWRGVVVVGSGSQELCPERGHSQEQSFELAAGAARSWVDPRWSLELSADASPNERSCLERGQARHRTEVR